MTPTAFARLTEDRAGFAPMIAGETRDELIKRGFAPMARLEDKGDELNRELMSWQDSYGGRVKFIKEGDAVVVFLGTAPD